MIEQEKRECCFDRARFARRRHDVPTGPTVYLGEASPKPPLENGASERLERVAAANIFPIHPTVHSIQPDVRPIQPDVFVIS